MTIDGICPKHGWFDAHWHIMGETSIWYPHCPVVECKEKVTIKSDEHDSHGGHDDDGDANISKSNDDG